MYSPTHPCLFLHAGLPPPAPVAVWPPDQLACARSILTASVASAIERLPPEQQALLLTMPCGSLPWGTQEFGLADTGVLQALEGLQGTGVERLMTHQFIM
jgi:hypothetical protein